MGWVELVSVLCYVIYNICIVVFFFPTFIFDFVRVWVGSWEVVIV